MILVIDNYDSFTYNLVQYLGELGAELRVFRNDQITLDEIRALNPSHIVISPGPGEPTEGGVSNDVIRELHQTIPILGVCLGHQCMGEVFGGTVARAPRLMHGKTSRVFHRGSGLYEGMPNPFEAHRARAVARTTHCHRVHRSGRSDGFAAQDRANVRRAISSRIGSHTARETVVEKFFGSCE